MVNEQQRSAERLAELPQRPCTFWDERPDPQDISLLVIHNISLPPAQFGTPYIDQFFGGQLDCNAHPYFAQLAGVRVSAHCVIFRDGRVWQYVPFQHRAWHAGVSFYQGRERCNDFSIGIELEGTDDLDYTEAQYQALVQLSADLIQQYPQLSVDHVVGHNEIAPLRKTDPGPAFRWDDFRTSLVTRLTSMQNLK